MPYSARCNCLVRLEIDEFNPYEETVYGKLFLCSCGFRFGYLCIPLCFLNQSLYPCASVSVN